MLIFQRNMVRAQQINKSASCSRKDSANTILPRPVVNPLSLSCCSSSWPSSVGGYDLPFSVGGDHVAAKVYRRSNCLARTENNTEESAARRARYRRVCVATIVRGGPVQG